MQSKASRCPHGDNDSLIGNDGIDVIFGGDGDDTIDGGAGDDVLCGENGSDLLLGGRGNDQLYGGNDRDLLIGGTGIDSIFGGGKEDILVGGSSVYDADYRSLKLILREWNSTGSYAVRVANIRNGAGPYLARTGVKLTSAQVINDNATDKLFSGSDAGWFIAGINDKLFDRKRGDELN